MKVTIKVQQDEPFVVECAPSDTILLLKTKIQEQKGFDPNVQTLFRSGVILKDVSTIEECNIHERHFVFCGVTNQAPVKIIESVVDLLQPETCRDDLVCSCASYKISHEPDAETNVLVAKLIVHISGASALLSGDAAASILAELLKVDLSNAHAVSDYGKSEFKNWSETNNHTENTYRIIQHLLAKKGIIAASNTLGVLGVLERAPEPEVLGIGSGFHRLFDRACREEDGFDERAWVFKYIDYKLAMLGVYVDTPEFRHLDQDFRAKITLDVVRAEDAELALTSALFPDGNCLVM